MYFSGTLEIDPSQITLIKSVQPNKLFGRLLNKLTMGLTSEKQEQETFTAVSILQQLNMGLRSINVKNVIRLSVDDYNFYLDESGVDDDMKQAMLELEAKIDPLESEIFNSIELNLEHEKESLKHVIEISIKRKHKVGEYPLIINVSSLVADLKIDKNLDRTGLESKMKKIFESQESYNAFVSEKQFLFDKFLSMLELGVRKFIKIDNVKRSSQLNIIRPSGKKAVLEPDKSHYGTSAYFDMYNLKDYFFYTMLWSSLSFSNNLYLNNFFLVDEYGSNVMGVGSEGFHAGNSDTMNPDAAFEPPQSGDIEFYGDNQFEEELQNDGLLDGYESADYEEDSFDWMDTGDSFSDVDSGSCSSCASYSSD